MTAPVIQKLTAVFATVPRIAMPQPSTVRRLAALAWLIGASCAGTSLAQPMDFDALRNALAGPDRDVGDYIRDEVRKPVEVLQFLGITPGMTVLDLYAAGGYYTFILSKAVGENGTVYAQNTQRGLGYIENRQNITQGQALYNKIQLGQLDNVTQIVRPLADIGLAENSLDLIMVSQVLHDYHNPNPVRAFEMLQRLFTLLKPGGVVGIIDHVGVPEFNNVELHRMEIQHAINLAEAAGFEVTQSDILRVSSDNHSRSIFDPRLNRSTDRFLLRLEKPR
jgi:predicted methyltransferase